MIIFKKMSPNDNTKIVNYEFSGVGLWGVISVDRESKEAFYQKVDGIYSFDLKEMNQILYIAKKKILESNFPERCIYATH